MLTRIADWLPVHVDVPSAAMVSVLLLGWVAAVYLAMAFGVRSGDLVWSGRRLGRLPAEQRWWSFLHGVGLIASGFVLLEMARAIPTTLISEAWQRSAGFVVTSLLGIATVFALFKGSTWERMLFVPITLLGSGLAAWITFA